MEFRISFSNVVGKRLALGYTHFAGRLNGYPERSNGLLNFANGLSSHSNGLVNFANGLPSRSNGLVNFVNGLVSIANG